MPRPPRALFAVALLFAAASASASNVGKRYLSEKTSYVDPVTGLTVTVLTTDPAGTSKPYQTHTTWTADGKWILGRSNRGGNGSQAFLINETTGDIIQLTDGPGTGTGSLNLSRKEMKLWFMRGGPPPGRRDGSFSAPATPPPKGAVLAVYGKLTAVEEPVWPARVVTLELSDAEFMPAEPGP